MSTVNDQQPFDVEPDDLPAPSTATAEPAVDADAEADRTRRKHRRFAALGIAAAVIFTAGAGGGAAASLALARGTTTTSIDGGTGTQQGGTGTGTGQGSGGFGSQNGFGSQGGFGSGGQGTSGTGSSAATDATTASSEQIAGLVTIVSQLGYEDGEAAGTGIVLTSGGRILTNNHVIDGATAIQVTDVSTGKSYTAKVVGTNATKDVAVLQLENASGLTTADLATSAAAVGDAVTAVGNANGTGTLSAAEGTVSALDQTITTSSEGSAAGETLDGLIEVDADVVSGDSGGAVENSSGDVIGVTTAASSGTSDITGYAIPIGTAMSIASQIVAGDDTSEITIGLPAFLGVAISADTDATSGAVVGQVLSGTAAAGTDIAAGDVITAIGGTRISSGDELSAAIAKHAAGDSVRVTYTDSAGDSRTVTVTLTEGPAD
ncbi:S1C family serine protease [uncultured Amnibacterium sp.]|uniref:S1C family serine protease n=1 Tax=uncultured Amnibacterium sp. TaxID=1631851 RepID=UPI0035C9952A